MCWLDCLWCADCRSSRLLFDACGYSVVFLANLTTAIYLATISHIGKTSGLNSFGLMWCNGIICGPILLIWTLIRGDLKMTINFPLCTWFYGCFALFLHIGILLELLHFFTTTLNSADTDDL
ncbi:hypothetical protein PIB30_082209 [Stylosanthes scabra]|uniref:Uncharacterized protein n=1 Tax=Stylosanthes scabra TaxID=79078 RepID=A0ABU6VQE6_9FABA|nr:hypothetical protein [Stylosanthes scabra]